MSTTDSPCWPMPVETTVTEEKILKLCKKQKLWEFLRRYRHRIIDAEMSTALRAMYASSGRGAPVPPERLALAMILQVAFHVADHEVPTLTAVDRRWRMVLDCHDNDETQPAFSQGTVFHFRERARQQGLMSKLLDKTVRLAREAKGFSDKRLRMMIDSSPLLGAGRVEDTFNLLGRAIGQLVCVVAAEANTTQAKLAEELDLTVVSASSVKAALDVDWRLPNARNEALNVLIEQFGRLKTWLVSHFTKEVLTQPPLSDSIDLVERLIEQDTEPDPDDPSGQERRVRKGGADRQISISDPDMRHGRKTKTKLFTGYKRHITTDADVKGLVVGVHILPANVREHEAAAPLLEAIEHAGYVVDELHHDRGYLAAEAIHKRREQGMQIVSKPPSPPANKGRLGKADFHIDMTAETVTCPQKQTVPIRHRPSASFANFSRSACMACPDKQRCTNKSGQKVIIIHPREKLHQDMAAQLSTPEGRAARRERIDIEHTLARLGAIQGTKARYRGLQKNQAHTEACAVVANLHVLNQCWQQAA